eukprot:4127872-Amphidinium_carterae.1
MRLNINPAISQRRHALNPPPADPGEVNPIEAPLPEIGTSLAKALSAPWRALSLTRGRDQALEVSLEQYLGLLRSRANPMSSTSPDPVLASCKSMAPGGLTCLDPCVGGGGESPPVPGGVGVSITSCSSSTEGKSWRYMVALWLPSKGDCALLLLEPGPTGAPTSSF